MLPSADVDGALHVSKPYPSYTTAWARRADVAAPPPGAAVPTIVATMAMASRNPRRMESPTTGTCRCWDSRPEQSTLHARRHITVARRREGLHGSREG